VSPKVIAWFLSSLDLRQALEIAPCVMAFVKANKMQGARYSPS